MRKIVTLAAAIAGFSGLVTIAAPTAAEAQYYGGYGYRSYYAPRYHGGYYSDYYRLGNPNTRDALNTCSYC